MLLLGSTSFHIHVKVEGEREGMLSVLYLIPLGLRTHNML